MQTLTSRVKFWSAIVGATVALLAAAVAWPGSDDDAIWRNQREGERRQEAVVQANFITIGGRELFIDWGKSGAIIRTRNPSAPFERVVEVQRGDRVSIWVSTEGFDANASCSVAANGQIYPGELSSNGCLAKANIY